MCIEQPILHTHTNANKHTNNDKENRKLSKETQDMEY